MTPLEFTESKKYLPVMMRDHSFRGWLFRWIDIRAEKGRNDGGYLSKNLPNAVSAHIYVIDYFLWFMAQFGYTLQKVNRKDVEFYDIQQVIGDFENEERNRFFDELKKDLENRKKTPLGSESVQAD